MKAALSCYNENLNYLSLYPTVVHLTTIIFLPLFLPHINACKHDIITTTIFAYFSHMRSTRMEAKVLPSAEQEQGIRLPK